MATVVNGYGVADLQNLKVWQYLGDSIQAAITAQFEGMKSDKAEQLVEGLKTLEGVHEEIVAKYGEEGFVVFLQRVLVDMADDIALRAKKLKRDFTNLYEEADRTQELDNVENDFDAALKSA